jgi:hypothetical protein
MCTIWGRVYVCRRSTVVSMRQGRAFTVIFIVCRAALPARTFQRYVLTNSPVVRCGRQSRVDILIIPTSFHATSTNNYCSSTAVNNCCKNTHLLNTILLQQGKESKEKRVLEFLLQFESSSLPLKEGPTEPKPSFIRTRRPIRQFVSSVSKPTQ